MAWLDTLIAQWREHSGKSLVVRPPQSAAALPRNLTRLRQQRGLTVAELSRDAVDRDGRVGASTIREIERGATNPTLHTVLALSRALGVGVEALLEELGER